MNLEDLGVSISGIPFKYRLINGAGYCKDSHTALDLLRSESSGLNFGSITVPLRLGNVGDVYYFDGHRSLNSLGLPNKGMNVYLECLPPVVTRSKALGKPFILSIAGFSPDEFAELAQVVLDIGADIIEVNFGCPNVWDGGTQKRIFSFQPRAMVATLLLIKEIISGGKIQVWVKLSPFADPVLLEEVDSVLVESGIVSAVVTCNTFPNGFALRRDELNNIRPAISVGKGLAGMGGPAMKAIGLGQVIQHRGNLPQDIAIIGVGGICTGQDMDDYLSAGASLVQVVTALFEGGPDVFGNILAEYSLILERREQTMEV